MDITKKSNKIKKRGRIKKVRMAWASPEEEEVVAIGKYNWLFLSIFYSLLELILLCGQSRTNVKFY